MVVESRSVIRNAKNARGLSESLAQARVRVSNPQWLKMPILVEYPSWVKTIPLTVAHTQYVSTEKGCVPPEISYDNDLLSF